MDDGAGSYSDGRALDGTYPEDWFSRGQRDRSSTRVVHRCFSVLPGVFVVLEGPSAAFDV
jgi:hypothetical protein